MVYQVVNLSKEDQRDIKRPMFLDFRSYNNTVSMQIFPVKFFESSVSRSRKHVIVNSLMASSCCTIMTIPMGL
jgi:hypothetical protein